MKLILAVLVFCLLPVVAGAADETIESPKDCKKRLGSLRECFAFHIAFRQVICQLAVTTATISKEPQYISAAARCGDDSKKFVRPMYDALLQSTKKPAAVAATKKAMSAFIAVMAAPPGTVGLRNGLETALAELELEIP